MICVTVPLSPPLSWFMWSFIFPPHLDISGVIITTLYMPVHSARRHIHQALVMGYSFINDQIHFCGIAALWCMGRRADAGQADRLMLQYVSVCVGSFWLWRMMMMESRPHPIKRCGPLKLWAYSRFRRRMWSQTGSRSSNWTFLFLQIQNEFRV